METIQESAFEKAIAMETRSLSFYRAITLKVKDCKTRQVFELLAQEEAAHLHLFCGMFQGEEADLARLLGKNYVNTLFDPRYCSMVNSIDTDSSEKDALRIALEEEQACIDRYAALVETIRDPQVYDLFTRILDETRKQCEIISEEYTRLMGMAGSMDEDIFVRE